MFPALPLLICQFRVGLWRLTSRRKGSCVYVIDIRGYGQSARPPGMEEPPQNHPPIVRSGEAVRDIDAAVDLIGKRTGVSRVSLFGWATGGQWAGYYATLYSEKLSHLILLNALYGADAPHPVMGHGSEMEDPAHPGHLNPAIGAYRCSSADSLLGAWNRSIPNEHRARWRDPGLAAQPKTPHDLGGQLVYSFSIIRSPA